jgi:hypothetical protein
MSEQKILLQDVTSTEELAKFKSHPKLIPLLVTEVNDLTFSDLRQLSDSQIYCSLSVSIHDELQDRLDDKLVENKSEGQIA